MSMKKLFLVLILFISSIYICFAEDGFPGLEPIFAMGEQSDGLTLEEVISYGLRFSDCPEGSSPYSQSLEAFNQLKEKVTSKEFLARNDAERAEKILTVMYEKTLKQYKSQQTRLDVVFTEGTYNCISASLVYLALAKAAGLKTICVKTPTHAFCSVVVDGQRIDVETTNPYGYNPGRTLTLEQSGNAKKYAVIPKKDYANRADVSEATFVTLIGSNMASAWMNQNDYTRAVPMAATVMTFRSGQSEWEKADGRDCFNTVALNYAVILDKSGQYAKSVQWIDRIIERYGIDERTRGELNGSVYNAVADYTNTGKFSSARDIYHRHESLMSENFSFMCRKMIFLSEVQAGFEGKNADEALVFVQSQYSNELASDKSIKQTLDKWQEYYWVEKINALNKAGSYLEAAAVSEEGLKAMPNNYSIKNAGKSALYNHDVIVHNNMAKLANAKNYSEAMKVVEQGLSENPSSQTLQADKRRLQQMMNK